MQSVFQIPPEAVEFVPEDYFAPLDLAALFPQRPGAPLELDMGCGDGAFLVGMAGRVPEHNFLGVERLLGRVRKSSRRAARAGLAQVRLIRIESHYLVRHLLPPESATVMHVMFPDPWPKRRHNPRRLIQTEFLDAAQRVIAPGGELRLTTDDRPYYDHMVAVGGAHPGFAAEPWEPGEDYPQTDFERHFRGQGLPIYRLLLRKTEAPR